MLRHRHRDRVAWVLGILKLLLVLLVLQVLLRLERGVITPGPLR